MNLKCGYFPQSLSARGDAESLHWSGVCSPFASPVKCCIHVIQLISGKKGRNPKAAVAVCKWRKKAGN